MKDFFVEIVKSLRNVVVTIFKNIAISIKSIKKGK